jgi:hypothetical protein
MMIGLVDLQEIRDFLFYEVEGTLHRWSASPPKAYLAYCLQVAADRAATAGGPKAEAAALFFALSADKRGMGHAWKELPNWAALEQMRRNGLVMVGTPLDMRHLNRLKFRVAAGASWEEIRDWFEQHTEPKTLEEYDPHPNPHGYTEHPDDALADSSWVDEPYPEDP